jgi:hypothetical protein
MYREFVDSAGLLVSEESCPKHLPSLQKHSLNSLRVGRQFD